MTTQTIAARVFHRDQLDAWGVPHDLAAPADATEGDAVALHHEQVATRRWVSVHELVFRAPDDGKAYRVTYEQGLTEQQDGIDEWDNRDHVVGEEVEEYDRTVKAWRRVADRPADEEQPFVPRTELSYWQSIADALNAAESVGMSVGIDLDGTLTDHNTWSVVWDRAAKRWDVAGYEDDEGDDQAQPCTGGAAIDHDETGVCNHGTEEPRTPSEGDRYVKRAEPDAGRIVTVNRVWEAKDGHTAVAYEWDEPRASYSGSACPLDVFHRTYQAQQ
ncbi:hypothetical protein [Streptomyces sp. NPDC016675]|uniref:hypothetical protein n=1 Tax=Streptomyces sp. NPDC016675 TaxID=3364970 RepID=UPI003700FAD3